MDRLNKIQQKEALNALRKVIDDKKVILESIKKGVSAVELKAKGINIASPI